MKRPATPLQQPPLRAVPLLLLAVLLAAAVATIVALTFLAGRASSERSATSLSCPACPTCPTCPACPALTACPMGGGGGRTVALDANMSGGPPDTFPQVGYMVAVVLQGSQEDATATTAGGGVTWPLYGGRSPSRKDRWLYYTISPAAAGGGVKLPVHFERRDCMDEVACEQVNDGDSVSVPDAGVVTATARVYKRRM